MSEDDVKNFQQPGAFQKAPVVPQGKSEVKAAAAKKIAVIALQDIPFIDGRRMSAGMEFEILPSQFNEKLMKKK